VVVGVGGGVVSEKRYVVRLTEDERSTLTALEKTEERVAAKKRMRARVLLKIDQGEHGPAWTDDEAAEAFDVHVNTVRAIRRQLVEQGFEVALNRKKQASPSRKRLLEAKGEKVLLAVAKSKAPEGRARWTLHLLAGELVRLEVVPTISHETVRQSLKKTRSNRTSK
jgi:transposase